MPKKKLRKAKAAKLVKASDVQFRKTASGAEEWDVTADSGRVTIVTSSTSAAAMDDAKKVYAGALERLAKR